MPIILFCRICDASYGSVGDLPVRCPSCGRETKWGTSPPHTLKPQTAWALTVKDRQLLKVAKIAHD